MTIHDSTSQITSLTSAELSIRSLETLLAWDRYSTASSNSASEFILLSVCYHDNDVNNSGANIWIE